MPYPQPPQKCAGDEKEEGGQRQQPVPQGPPVKEVLQRPVLDQGQGHQEGEDEEHRLAVDAEGVLAVLPGPVHEDVQGLQMLQGEEGDAGVDEEHPEEDPRAAQDHEGQGESLGRGPLYRPRPQGPDQHDGGLEDPGEHGGLHVLAEHLEQQRPGPEHDAVELGLGEDPPEGVQPPGEALGQGGPGQDHGVAQAELGQSVAANGVEPLQQKHHAEEHVGGDQQMAQTAQKEGGAVGHGRAEMDGEELQV